MNKVKIIIGEKISLGLFEKEDLQNVLEGFSNIETRINYTSKNRNFHYRKDSENLLNDFSNENNSERDFAIIENISNETIGYISLVGIDFINRNSGISIIIFSEENHGKGFGKEAMKLVLKYSFEELNLHKVSLIVFGYNLKALNLYEKIGFKKCVTLKEDTFFKGQFYDKMHLELFRKDFKF